MTRPARVHGTPVTYKRGPSTPSDPAWVPRPDGGEGCRCAPCVQASRRDKRVSDYLRQTGRSRYVDAEASRAHVALLLAAGMTRYQVAGLTGGVVDRTSLRALMVGQGGRPPGRRVRRATETALLAVPVVPACAPAAVPDRGTVPAIGTRRRLEALMAAGYASQDLCARLGITPANGCQLRSRDRVLAVTARRVAALYAGLEQTPGDPVVAARYRRRGYLHPGWWDPATLDDPDHVPLADVPGGVRDRADRRTERRELTASLTEAGMTAADVLLRLRAAGLAETGADDASLRRTLERDKADWRRAGRSLTPRTTAA